MTPISRAARQGKDRSDTLVRPALAGLFHARPAAASGEKFVLRMLTSCENCDMLFTQFG